MAERLTAAGALALALALPAALAQPLADPMRPPAAASAAEGGPHSAPVGRVQSVLVSSGRRIAIIDGRLVSEGERFGEATVVGIGESGVTLERLGERRTLKLHSGVEKKPAPRGDQVKK